MTGRVTAPKTEIVNMNMDLLVEYSGTLDRCMSGWKGTIEILKRANTIIQEQDN